MTKKLSRLRVSPTRRGWTSRAARVSLHRFDRQSATTSSANTRAPPGPARIWGPNSRRNSMRTFARPWNRLHETGGSSSMSNRISYGESPDEQSGRLPGERPERTRNRNFRGDEVSRRLHGGLQRARCRGVREDLQLSERSHRLEQARDHREG